MISAWGGNTSVREPSCRRMPGAMSPRDNTVGRYTAVVVRRQLSAPRAYPISCQIVYSFFFSLKFVYTNDICLYAGGYDIGN